MDIWRRRWGLGWEFGNNVNNRLEVLDIAIPSSLLSYPFTIVAWCTFDTIGNERALFGWYDDAARDGWWIDHHPTNGPRCAIFDSVGGSFSSANWGSTLATGPGNLHMIAGVYRSASSRTIHVNGVEGATDTNSRSVQAANVDSIVIGAQRGLENPTAPHDGRIFDVRAYDRALTTPALRQMYLHRLELYEPLTTRTWFPLAGPTNLDLPASFVVEGAVELDLPSSFTAAIETELDLAASFVVEGGAPVARRMGGIRHNAFGRKGVY